MKTARINLALALALLVSGGGFVPAQAHCPHTDTHDDGSALGRPHPLPDHCNAVRPPAPTPAPASTLATAQGSPRSRPPAPPALPEAQTTQQLDELGPGPNRSQGASVKNGKNGKEGALGKDFNLATVLASLPIPRHPGWQVSTSVTTIGAISLGLAHLWEDESLSVSFGVGTDWSNTQGLAVLNLSL